MFYNNKKTHLCRQLTFLIQLQHHHPHNHPINIFWTIRLPNNFCFFTLQQQQKQTENQLNVCTQYICNSVTFILELPTTTIFMYYQADYVSIFSILINCVQIKKQNILFR